MNEESRPSAAAETANDLVGTGVTNRITPPSDIPASLAEYREWLLEHHDDPQLVAGCARLGRILGGAA